VPRAPGASWSPPRATSRTRPRRWRGDKPCGRSSIARPHGVRLGGTIRVLVRIVRAKWSLRSQDGAASLELIHRQQLHRCESTRGYHAWTKGITGLAAGSTANASEQCRPSRTSRGRMTTGRPTRRCLRSSACWRVRPRVRCSSKPSRSRVVLSKRAANESRHLRRYSSENQRDASIADQFRVCREFAPPDDGPADLSAGARRAKAEAGPHGRARNPNEPRLRIELRGNLAAMLTAAQQTKRSPDTGDLLVPIQLVAGAGFEPATFGL
jgi:hypothetical protein